MAVETFFIVNNELCPKLIPLRRILIEDKFGIRRLTAKECLTIKGFSADYITHKISYDKMLQLIGNASLVPIILRVAKEIIKVLDDEKSTKKEYCTKDEYEEKSTIKKQKNKSKLEVLFDVVEQAKDKIIKGKALESLMVQFFAQVEGFTNIQSNIRTKTEEIDVTIVNKSDNHIFKKEKVLILVECKNWHTRVGRCDLDSFEKKILNRNGRCTIGFFCFLEWSNKGF